MGTSDNLGAFVVSATDNTAPLEDICAAVDRLPINAKAALVNYVLGNNELNIVLGNPISVTSQVDTMSFYEMGVVLEAIAKRMADNQ